MTVEITSDWWREKFPIAEGNPSVFWSGVRDNSIPSSELIHVVECHLEYGDFSFSNIAQAAAELLELRFTGRLPKPEEGQISG